MAHRIRWYLPLMLLEVTIKTLEGRFWLRPDPRCRAIVLGVFGKALKHYPGVRLHGFETPSNHLHYLVSATEPAQLPLFLDFVHANIARQINQLRQRTGPFWSRRGMVIAVVDDDAQIARLRYLLAQGPKAGLVASPKDWEGASSTPALLGDMALPATYTSLDVRRRNAKRARPLPEEELGESVPIRLAPLPVWEKRSAKALRAAHEQLVASIEQEYAHTKPRGAKWVRSQSPDERPADVERSAAPLCHASTLAAVQRYRTAYRTFRDHYRRATSHDSKQREPAKRAFCSAYPHGALARARFYIAPPTAFVLPWQLGPDAAASVVRT
ncbi:MAG: hypothetical protein IPH44_40495 [Myxococcales bacterium]|nr:hypothetical protein [Myxococcales bacterium]